MLKFPGIATLICVFLATATPAQQPSQDKSIPEIDSVVQSVLSDLKIPGASIAIARNGKLLYARGYGKANQDTPVLPTHLFRIASISKPITAIAIMQLMEANKLRLSDKVTDILAFQPVLEGDAKPDQRWKEITIEQLLQHRAGFNRDKTFDPMFRSTDIAKVTRTSAPANPDAIIRYMMGRPLDFDPGTNYSYSNFGYCLLGRVIEKNRARLTRTLSARTCWNLWAFMACGLDIPWRKIVLPTRWNTTRPSHKNIPRFFHPMNL